MHTVKVTPWETAPGFVEKTTFALGDIHGQYEELMLLYPVLEDEMRDENYNLVYLGDYIDRGPSPIKVLNQVFSWSHPKANIVRLPGNHELMMLSVLQDPNNFMWWYQNGGSSMIEELKINVSGHPFKVMEELILGLGDNILRLAELPTAVQFDKYLFVHGGVPVGADARDMPSFDWHEETDGDPRHTHPLWMRKPFLENNEERPDGIVVVHGHTVNKNFLPSWTINRINIDTGSVFGGRLTMIELNKNKMRFYHVFKGVES